MCFASLKSVQLNSVNLLNESSACNGGTEENTLNTNLGIWAPCLKQRASGEKGTFFKKEVNVRQIPVDFLSVLFSASASNNAEEE